MTPNDFRRAALDLPATMEGEHMDHPDFRVGAGKRMRIFASLGPGDRPAWGMVKLSPEDQEAFLRAEPGSFEAFGGAWGRQGCTKMMLAAVKKATGRSAIIAAWRNVAPKRVVQSYDEED